MESVQLRQKRAKLIADARGVLDGAEAEKRDLTGEEQAKWDALMAEAEGLKSQIDRVERQAEAERELATSTGRVADESVSFGLAGSGLRVAGDGLRVAGERFESRSMRGMDLNAVEWRRFQPMARPEYARGFERWLRTGQMGAELRALQADVDIYGGYLTPPMQFVDGLIRAVDNAVFIRQWADVQAVPNADSLGQVSLDNDPADPTWTSELAIGSEDSTMSLGLRALTPHPLAKYIKISKTLLRKAPNVEALVRERLAYKFAVTMENAYLNGDGAAKPLGVFTASAQGISTGRDVSTGNTATEIRFDGLIEAKYTLKGQYWPRARWIFHRDGIKQIAKLKDGEGQYIWSESVRVGEPDRILGIPAFMSEYAPNTFTTLLYVGILGDFSFYHIVDALDMTIQRLVELYAATNQDGFHARMESDGMPVLEEAFVRVKLG